MFRKTLTATVAALTLTGASLSATTSAQAGGLGKFIVVGAVVGGALASRSSEAAQPAYRPAYGGGYGGGCGFRNSPIFDEYGHRVGFRRVSAC